MVSLARIVRDYRDAGGVNRLLALWGFVDDDVLLTKTGHLVIAWRVRGIDFEQRPSGTEFRYRSGDPLAGRDGQLRAGR